MAMDVDKRSAAIARAGKRGEEKMAKKAAKSAQATHTRAVKKALSSAAVSLEEKADVAAQAEMETAAAAEAVQWSAPTEASPGMTLGERARVRTSRKDGAVESGERRKRAVDSLQGADRWAALELVQQSQMQIQMHESATVAAQSRETNCTTLVRGKTESKEVGRMVEKKAKTNTALNRIFHWRSSKIGLNMWTQAMLVTIKWLRMALRLLLVAIGVNRIVRRLMQAKRRLWGIHGDGVPLGRRKERPMAPLRRLHTARRALTFPELPKVAGLPMGPPLKRRPTPHPLVREQYQPYYLFYSLPVLAS